MGSIKQIALLALFAPALCAIFRRHNGDKHDIITEAPDKLPVQTDLPSQTIKDTGIGVFISGKQHSVTVQIFGADSNQFNTPDAQAAEQTRPATTPKVANQATEDADAELDSDTIAGLIADQLAAQAAAQPSVEDASEFIVSDNDRDDDFPKDDDQYSGILARRGLSFREIHKKLLGVFDRLKNGVDGKTKWEAWKRDRENEDWREEDFYDPRKDSCDQEDDDEDYDEDDFYASSDFDDVDFDDANFFDLGGGTDF